jgi:hypothetical protein
MRALIAGLGLMAAVPLIAACSSLGERSTLAELAERCEARRGTLVAGSSEAEGGVRCDNPSMTNAALPTPPGATGRYTSMNVGVDRAMRGAGASPH